MNGRDFIKTSGKFYKDLLTVALRSLFPKTTVTTHFVKQLGFTQFLEIQTEWLGVTLESQCYELADTSEKKELLDELLKNNAITEAEYKKYLSPLRQQRQQVAG